MDTSRIASVPAFVSAVVCASAAFLLCAGVARADADAAAGFPKADKDHNGYVDRGEYHQRMVEVFYLSDDNKDGRLEKGEIGKVGSKDFDQADRNHDGKLTLNEYTEARDWEFDALDADGDGRITLQEAEAYKR
jgi:Ca2+-binding EF-hand superfamily protein